MEDYQARGIISSEELLEFDILHQTQVNASIEFADNEFFGTFRSKENGGNDNYEYITYHEYGEKVDHCRTV